MERKYIQYEIKDKSKYLEMEYFQKEKLTTDQVEIYVDKVPKAYKKKLWLKTLNSDIYLIPDTNLLYKERGGCINELVGIKLPGMLFPTRKILCVIERDNYWGVNHRIENAGYVMEKLKGNNFIDKNSKNNLFTMPYNDILKIINTLRKNLYNATETGLYFYDADFHNVIITPDKSPIVIDHDYTYLSYDIGGSKSKLNSMHCYTILDILKLDENADKFKDYLVDNKLLQYYINYAKSGALPVDEFIEIINMYYQKLIGSNIKTLSLARKNINML